MKEAISKNKIVTLLVGVLFLGGGEVNGLVFGMKARQRFPEPCQAPLK